MKTSVTETRELCLFIDKWKIKLSFYDRKEFRTDTERLILIVREIQQWLLKPEKKFWNG